MTGFGDASVQEDDAHYAVELRSLNNRYFKASIRLPEVLARLEADLDKVLRKHVNRGSVVLTVSFQAASSAAAGQINAAALQSYLDQLSAVPTIDPTRVDVGALLALPGVVQPPDSERLIDRARPILLELVGSACRKLLAMREKEGKGLVGDLLGQCGQIRERLGQIGERAPLVVEEYHQRLRNRIEQLLARAELNVAAPDLIREVAVFAERCDVAEEVQRLGAHIEQFNQMLTEPDGEPAGRTLDFIAQEMLREANTIGSKSNDASIGRWVVEIKGAIDRIKEQAQNIE